MSVRPRLLLASGLMLFVELALIRWLGANIVHLGYFTNFVLLGSFLGIGLGFLIAGRTGRPVWWPGIVLVALVATASIAPVTIDRSDDSVIYFTSLHLAGPPAWLVLPVVFIAVAAVLIGPASVVAVCFRELAPLEAYRLDIIGSLVGIAAFTALSFLRAPSVAWGCVVALAWLLLAAPRPSIPLTAAMVGLIGILAVESLAAGVSWSPYYKITTQAEADSGFLVTVNGVPHQEAVHAETRLTQQPQYGLPYERLVSDDPGDVLIIGAGTGTDVAIALEKGAKSVTAVEIDPRLLQIGQEQHPDQPYDDPRVTTVIDDGRAFLERTDQTFDLVLFALPDSLALVNGGGGVRLESYLFTEEAIEAARDRLNPSGGFAMYNFYREDWLVDRLANTVDSAFDHPPCVDRIGDALGQAVIAAAVDAEQQNCATAATYTAVAPATDDRPFLYVRGSGIPAFYLIAVAAILLISLAAVRVVGGRLAGMRTYADLFFMGAAFLLLETRSVTTFALLFGTTWVVNAIVFAGVLVVVLLAVEVTRRMRTPGLPILYALLAAALALAYVVPNAWILQLPTSARAVVAIALAFAPVFFANLAFAKRFSTTANSTTAFATNILGAMVGGCLEYLALMVGYRNLLIVAGLLYLAAFLLRPRVSAPVTA